MPRPEPPHVPGGVGAADAAAAVVDAIADGREVDWVEQSSELAASGSAHPPESRLEALRLISEVAEVFARHREEEPRSEASAEGLFRWGRLVALEKIGSGGFGEVYRANDPQLERPVALKLHHGAADGGVLRFLAEARRLARVRHPNVVTIHGADTHMGRAGLWTDLIEGRTVSDLVKAEGPFGAHETAGLGVELCRALAAIHGVGLVHGDVKPSNVMREVGGRIVLMDFGAARDRSDAGPAVQASLVTAAPEVLAGEPPTPASDLYSLGATLFHVASGQYPVDAGGRGELSDPRHARRRRLRDLRPDLPAELVEVVERTLEPDPGRRPQSAGELEESLRRVSGLSSESVGVTGPEPARRTFVLGGAALLVALGVLGLGWWWRERVAGPSLSLEGQRLISDFPGSSHAAVFSPDGEMIAFLNDRTGRDQVWVQPSGGGAPIQVTRGAVPAERPRWSSRGEIVFGRVGAGIWAVGPLGGEPRQLLEQGRSPDVSPDGSRLVYQRGNEIWLADLDAGTSGPVESVPRWLFSEVDAAPAYSPDGEAFVYFHQRYGPLGDLFVVAVASGDRRRLTFDETEASGPSFSPDGRSVVFSSLRSGSRLLWRVPFRGGEPEPVTRGAGEDGEPVLGPDGRRLVFTNVRRRSVLEIYDPKSGEQREILESRMLMNLPKISPDGSRIVYFQQLGAAGVHLFVVSTEGGTPLQLTSSAGGQLIHPRWSPDGRTIYFYDNRDGGFLEMPAAGGVAETVFEGWRWQRENSAEISPEGDRVLYTELGVEVEQTWVRRLDGTGEPQSVPLPHLHLATWSPDGANVIGWRHDGNTYLCSLEQSTCRVLIENAQRARFDPAGDAVYFHRPGERPDTWRLFRYDLETAREEEIVLLGPCDPLSAVFSLGPDGEVVSATFESERRELWLAELR